MLEIDCAICGDELTTSGALLFSPPFINQVSKYHLCQRCWSLTWNTFLLKLKDQIWRDKRKEND